MDRQRGCVVGTAAGAQKCYQIVKKTIQFLVVASFFSFLYSYFSGFPFFFFSSYDLQFSTLIFSLFAHALDRKYMFLICNGILAFLAKNLSFGSSSSSNYSGFTKTAEDGVKQITELPAILKEETVDENAASRAVTKEEEEEEEETEQQQERDYGDIREMKMEGVVLERGEWEEEEEDDDDDNDELKENKVVEGTPPMEEINDASVSTEELNKKFEEFIRKMKEEIRIDAQQQLITV